MLVITRKENQSIIIGEDIEVKIARINRNRVRIGISAPRFTPVYRKEITSLFDNNVKISADSKAVQMAMHRL